MIRLILVVIAIIFASALSVFLTLNPGSVSFRFLGIEGQMPFALAIGLFLIATFAILVVWRLILGLWTAPDKFRQFNVRRRKEKGFDALENALIAAAAGEGEIAVRQAARADALLDRPALSRLLAARAAEAAGNLPGAEAHYEAMLEDPKSKLVAQRGLAQIAHERGAHSEAATYAKAAFEQSKSASWAFDALFDAQVAQGDWAAALETLNEGEKRRRIPVDRARRRRAVLLTAQALECENTDAETARSLAEKAASAAPGFAPAVVLAARLLAPVRKHKRAEELIKSAWSAEPHPALARALGDLRKSDTRAKRAERLRLLAAMRPEHRESKLLLAEAALDASQAEAARAVLDPLLNMGTPSARLCALASRLARQEDDDAAARRWMTRASHAPGEADWSDIDGEGRAFSYSPEDWKRMVYAYGDEGRMTHPRYERFEIAAGAVPENALLEAPKPARKAAPAPEFYDAPRPPDDPGIDEDDA
ncbi:MAG: heme biosynthesis protein HemY [Rhodobacterales bacterium CG15_BIG_FIL_POST_REV_8_21_14_020_59_13]|nr:MAG: heme biosynthesis protein HemY [Rhodobacterales bacterium CG15_BIG_FIL_POST_REV_8_21_14_020_59_13]